MHKLEAIAERIRQSFDDRTAAREEALSQTRAIIRYCANAIRAIHRENRESAKENLCQAQRMVKELKENLLQYPDIYYAGYTQDALKEYAEASIVYGLTDNSFLPEPEELGLEYATYLKGLAEAVGELRRRCLDILRHQHSDEVERLLSNMDDIYAVLMTMDYPEAITGGLRRWTDIARGIIEHTRGDLTLSLRQGILEKSLLRLEKKLEDNEGDC
jgi:translin